MLFYLKTFNNYLELRVKSSVLCYIIAKRDDKAIDSIPGGLLRQQVGSQ